MSLSARRIERHAETDRRLLLHPILGLVLAVIRMSAGHGLTHWYFVTEPRVVRLLRRVGMQFQEITGDIEYHGIRRAYTTGISEFLERVYHDFHPRFGPSSPSKARYGRRRLQMAGERRSDDPA